MWRKIKIIVATTILSAIAFGVLYFGPFFCMPPESKESLEAKVEEYRQVSDAVRLRPLVDRKKILQLTDEMKLTLRANENGYPFDEDTCPEIEEDKIQRFIPEIKRVLGYDTRLQEILSDGFILQDADNQDEDLFFTRFRGLLNYHLDAAVLAAAEGDSKRSADIILSMVPLVEGLLRTPVVMGTMIGVALSEVLGRTIIYLIPRLSMDDLVRIYDRLGQYPDAVETLLDAMKVYFFRVSESWRDVSKSDDTNLFVCGFWGAVEMIITQKLGFMKKERYWFIFLSANRLKLYQAWHRDGAVNPPDFNGTIKDDMQISPLTAIATPDWDSLVGIARRADIRIRAVRAAIDAELSMRRAGKRTDFEIPYDDHRRLILNDQYGCTIAMTKTKTIE